MTTDQKETIQLQVQELAELVGRSQAWVSKAIRKDYRLEGKPIRKYATFDERAADNRCTGVEIPRPLFEHFRRRGEHREQTAR